MGSKINVPVRKESTMKGGPEFFRLLYAIVKIAFVTARITAINTMILCRLNIRYK